jgi:predicted 2-oxoglutarate/Fe(II)-dependent dioxygenase YbiX
MDSRRDYHPAYHTSSVTLGEASAIFGKTKSVLKEMSRHSLARLYRRHAQKLHPDKGGDHDKFVKLSRAYHDLLKTKKF